MALIRSLNTAVSGLKAQQFRIEVIGNNIANVDTTAFKGSRVDFASLLSQTVSYGVAPQGFLGGIDPVEVGLGVKVGSATTDFNQGPTEATGIASDLALQGDGFFVLNDSTGSPVYTRDGSFTINPSNLLHDPASGYIVQGWRADDNFQVNPGGALEDIEIAVGTKTIARATTRASFQGNLDSSGEIASEGTLLLSDQMFDNRISNTDPISSQNPLGLARATADTPLQNLVRSDGGFIRYDASTGSAGSPGGELLVFEEFRTQLTGIEIQVTGDKGDGDLISTTFTVGDPPPTGGTTLGHFMEFLQRTMGINDGTWDNVEQTEHTYSYNRRDAQNPDVLVNGTVELNSASLGSLTDSQVDFRSVQVGDFIRFTGGQASGEFAEITGIEASVPGGRLDTLMFRTDGFNSLSIVPGEGDTFAIHAPADVRIATDTVVHSVAGGSPTVSVGAPTTNGELRSFTITDSAVGNFILERGVNENQRVEFQSGGATVSGWITQVSGNAVTVSYRSTAAIDPDAGTDFQFIDQAEGTIEIAGNVGSANHLSALEIVSAESRVSMFDNPPVIDAEGESLRFTTTVYDSLGTPRQVNLTFVYEGSSSNGPNTWRYFAESADDADVDPVVGSGTVVFGATGQFLTTGRPTENISINLAPTADAAGGAVSPFTFEIDLSRLTQFASTNSEMQTRDQDGFESGTLRDFTISADGTIEGSFDNGLNLVIGQIAVARFANPDGLEVGANNFYRAAPNSGIPGVGIAGTFGRGTMISGFLEESNVDLAAQFTDLIIGQRAFQANARTITVSDEMLQELVNLI